MISDLHNTTKNKLLAIEFVVIHDQAIFSVPRILLHVEVPFIVHFQK